MVRYQDHGKISSERLKYLPMVSIYTTTELSCKSNSLTQYQKILR